MTCFRIAQRATMIEPDVNLQGKLRNLELPKQPDLSLKCLSNSKHLIQTKKLNQNHVCWHICLKIISNGSNNFALTKMIVLPES